MCNLIHARNCLETRSFSTQDVVNETCEKLIITNTQWKHKWLKLPECSTMDPRYKLQVNERETVGHRQDEAIVERSKKFGACSIESVGTINRESSTVAEETESVFCELCDM